MGTDTRIDTWTALVSGVKANPRIKSFALVAVDEDGEVYWGSSFGHEPTRLLRRLRTIEQDIKQHIKRRAPFT